MARRKANGEGTIYRRQDGRYEAAAYFLTTSGNRKRVRVYGKTRQEVHAKLVETKAQADRGVPVPERTWKVREYLDYWLENIVRISQRPATYMRYENIVRLHLKPALGSHTLDSLTVPITQSLLREQLTQKTSLLTVS